MLLQGEVRWNLESEKIVKEKLKTWFSYGVLMKIAQKVDFLRILTLFNSKNFFTSTSGGHNFGLSWDILDFLTENERLETKKVMIVK